MSILNLPLNQFIGIKKNENNLLELDLTKNIKNHVGSIHAGAQFIFAESASAIYLVEMFPELKDKTLPLLRSSDIKFKKTAFDALIAYPSICKDTLQKFQKQFLKRGKGSITVDVILKNIDKESVAICTFNWFIQKV